MKIQIKDKIYEADFLNNEFFEEIKKYFPIKGNLVKWGGEIYILVDFDLGFEKEGNIFEVGDVVYWRSNRTGNKGIAIFFGNTPNSNKPKANENCDCKLIGKLKENNFDISNVEKEDLMKIF